VFLNIFMPIWHKIQVSFRS